MAKYYTLTGESLSPELKMKITQIEVSLTSLQTVNCLIPNYHSDLFIISMKPQQPHSLHFISTATKPSQNMNIWWQELEQCI